MIGKLVRLKSIGAQAESVFLFVEISEFGPDIHKECGWMQYSDVGIVIDCKSPSKSEINPEGLSFCKLLISGTDAVGWVREDWLESI